jgi:hypothetical protein
MNKKRVVISSFLLPLALALAGCAGGGGGGSSTPAAVPAPVPVPPASVAGPGISISSTYTKAAGLTGTYSTDAGASLVTTGSVGRNGAVGNVSDGTVTSANATAAGGTSLFLNTLAINQPSGFQLGNASTLAASTQIISGQTSTFATVADAKAGGGSPTNYSYLTFGGWTDCGPNCTTPTEAGVIGYYVAGTETPASGIPLSGTATYTGFLQGIYLNASHTAYATIANVAIAADFSARSLSFSTNSSSTYSLLASVTTAVSKPDLDMSGTLRYTTSNPFGGTVADAGGRTGTASGRFFGTPAPGAKPPEVGGVFGLHGADGSSHTGSFVAK